VLTVIEVTGSALVGLLYLAILATVVTVKGLEMLPAPVTGVWLTAVKGV